MKLSPFSLRSDAVDAGWLEYVKTVGPAIVQGYEDIFQVRNISNKGVQCNI